MTKAKREGQMILYPKLYLNSVFEISLEILEKNNIKGLILDVDNTLIDIDRVMPEGLETWCEDLKNANIKMCIVSNTNKLKKVKKVATDLDIPYISFAKKPSKKGFYKAMEILELESKHIAVVGDQIMTDVLGGNRVGMFTILTKPLDKRDIILTRVKRPLENIIIRKYLKNNN